MGILALVFALIVAPAHGFDYQFGTWNVHVSRLASGTGSAAKWVTYDGTHTVTPLWHGRANIGVLEIRGSAGSIEGTQLRLFDPGTGQWKLWFASSSDGELQPPSVGSFHSGIGDFRNIETVDGKTVLVRTLSTMSSMTSYRDVIARSYDNGKTWTQVWIATYEKQRPVLVLAAGPPAQHGGPHDFDFEFGTWKAHLKRILHPFSHDTTWVQYEGLSIVHPMIHGNENVGELEVRGPAGSINGITIRTYDVDARQWNIHWVNAKAGVLTSPMIGGFSGDTGTFYGSDTLDGKPILVRFVFSSVEHSRFHFEQAFSADGGKTWEVNWVADFTRGA